MIKYLCMLLIFSNSLFAKIYDCFIFYNELDLLELRFEELYPYVDKFVLVESLETFRGKDKPLYFAENKDRYQKFLDKIIHVVVEDRLQTDDPWVRENYQRNQIMRGLTACEKDDCILISDVDEIPRGSKIEKFVQLLSRAGCNRVGTVQKLFFYYLNRYRPDWSEWNGTSATRFSFLKKSSPQWIRDHRGDSPLIEDMGWHFTWMGGPELVKSKVFSTPHLEYEHKINYLQDDLIQQLHIGSAILPINETNFPKFVVENQQYLIERGLLEP